MQAIQETSQNTSSSITFQTGNFRWLLLFVTLLFGFLPGGLLILEGIANASSPEDGWELLLIGVIYGFLFGVLPLWGISWQKQMTLDTANRQVLYIRRYWLGVGRYRRIRTTALPVHEIEAIKVLEAALKDAIVVRDVNRKSYQFPVSHREHKKVRSFIESVHRLQGMPRSLETSGTPSSLMTSQKPITNPEQLKIFLDKQGKGLSWMGGLDIIIGLFGVLAGSLPELWLVNWINIIGGSIYLACGFGIRKRWMWAPWMAILVLVGERLLSYFYSQSHNLPISWSFWVFPAIILILLLGTISTISNLERQVG